MAGWSDEELHRIAAAEELDLAPVRRDGELRRAAPIWVVQVGGDLYVRAAYGSGSGWYGVARTSRRAEIRAGGVTKHVAIEDADEAVLGEVDAGYRSKYGSRYATIVDTINDAEHRTMTLRLVPREAA